MRGEFCSSRRNRKVLCINFYYSLKRLLDTHNWVCSSWTFEAKNHKINELIFGRVVMSKNILRMFEKKFNFKVQFCWWYYHMNWIIIIIIIVSFLMSPKGRNAVDYKFFCFDIHNYIWKSEKLLHVLKIHWAFIVEGWNFFMIKKSKKCVL